MAVAAVSTGSEGPFEYTATGVLGEQRNTMLANELHLRDELGRSKTRGYVYYPGPSFLYGRANPPRDIGVAETMRWNDSVPAVTATKGLSFAGRGTKDLSNAPRDFMRLNRASVDVGLTTSRQQSDFRATNDFRCQPKSRNTRANGFTQRRPPADMVYGRPTRPSTPIHQLIEHRYQDEWVEHQHAIQLSRAKKAQVQKLPPGAYRENHTSQLRNCLSSTQPSEPRPLWQISRFSKSAQGQLDTFRSPEDRQRAWKQYAATRSQTIAYPIY